MASLTLKFFRHQDEITLEETTFSLSPLSTLIRGVRGKRMTYGQISRFHWSDSIHAFCILAVRHRMFGGTGRPPNLFVGATLLGEAKTPAATLDYALTKKPNWMTDLFGLDESGEPILRTLIGRMNPERKRPGPVRIWFHTRSLDPSDIKIIVNDHDIDSRELLEECMSLLEKSWSLRSRTRGRRVVKDQPDRCATLPQKIVQVSRP